MSNYMCHVQLDVGTCVSTILHEMAWLQKALTCLSIFVHHVVGKVGCKVLHDAGAPTWH